MAILEQIEFLVYMLISVRGVQLCLPIVIPAHASDGQLKVSVVTKYIVLLRKVADFVKGSIQGGP